MSARKPKCEAKGPVRWLWGRKTTLICQRERGHWGAHTDATLTGFTEQWGFRKP